MERNHRVSAIVVAALTGTLFVTSLNHGAVGAAAGTVRAFSAASTFNTALSSRTPIDPNSQDFIDYLKRDSSAPYVRLVGTESSGGWGDPIYWASAADPVYNVVAKRYKLPSEFRAIRIPRRAATASTSDAEMTIYDQTAGAVYKLWQGNYDAGSDTWSASGGSYYYLSSNGLHGSLSDSDEPRNTGHRGVPPAIHAVRWDEIQAGRIDHALKIAINTPSGANVWPMTGSDGDSSDPDAPPQGTRLRIKPSVDLSKLGLSPPALVVATALQRYGAIIGDSSGGPAALKVENTVVEGRGWLWKGVLEPDSLQAIPFDLFEVIELGHKPQSGDSVTPVPAPTAPPVLEPTPTPEPSSPAPPTNTSTSRTAIFDTIADSTLPSKYPKAVLGSRARIRVSSDPSTDGLVKFQISGLYGDVSAAVLRLYALEANARILVHQTASSSWHEPSVTWNTAPAPGLVVASSDANDRRSWIEFDIATAIDGNGTYTFRITSLSGLATFASKEGRHRALVPELKVTTRWPDPPGPA